MHIEEKQSTEASEVFAVHVPMEHFIKYTDVFIDSKSKTFRKDGFRPGKVPIDIVRSYFIEDACAWAEEQIVQEGWRELQKQYADRKWTGHSIYSIDQTDEKLIKIDFTCEVWPELDLNDKKPPAFERISIKLSPKTLQDEIIPAMIKNHEVYESVGPDATAELDDVLTLRMYFRHKGKEIPNSRIKGETVRLSEANLHPGRTDSIQHSLLQLVGKKVGDVVRGTFRVNKEFNWGQRALIGEKVEYEYRLDLIERQKKETSTKDLASHFDIDEKDLESHIHSIFNHYAELVQAMREKREVFDYLNDTFTFDISETRWREEADNIQRSYGAEEYDEESENIAKRRVRLGIVINKLSQQCPPLSSDNFHKVIELYALTHRVSVHLLFSMMHNMRDRYDSLSNAERQYVNSLRGAMGEWQVANHILEKMAEPKKTLDWEKCKKDWASVLPHHFLEDEFLIQYLMSGQKGNASQLKESDATEPADNANTEKKAPAKKKAKDASA